MTPLSPTQQKLLAYIQERIDTDGYPPTLREMCRRFGWGTPTTARRHLENMQRRGWIHRDRHRSRAITVRHAQGETEGAT